LSATISAKVQRDHPLVPKQLGTLPLEISCANPRQWPFCQTPASPNNTIVLRPPAEDLNDTLNFVLAANHRVHLALARNFRQISPERPLRAASSLRLAFLQFFRRPSFAAAASFLRVEVGIQLFQDLLACLFDIDVHILEDASGHTIASRSIPKGMCSVPT